MVKLKHIPEDFVVNEVSTVKLKESGKYAVFRLWKKNENTLDALRRIQNALHVRAVTCAGNKDKRAVTEQTCSVQNVSKKRVESLEFTDMKVTFLGYADDPVHLGQLEGNRFEIVVRDIEEKPKIQSRFRNFFGEQRFSENNADVGRAIVKRDFEQAVKLIAEKNRMLAGKMQKFIDEKQWVNALRSVPRKLLMIFVHAFQSWLWNEAAKTSSKETLPIVGFGSDIDEETKKVLEKEGITLRDFIIREFPEASVEGAERQVWAEAKDVECSELEDDECFPGKKKVKICFFLPKGCYATEFIHQLFQ